MSEEHPAQVTELIETPDVVEMIRDRIAVILSKELQNQRLLATKQNKNAADYNVKVFAENSRPYDTAENERLYSINVVLAKIEVSPSNSRVNDQKEKAEFHIFCIADGNDTGNFRDDKNATFRAWKILRLARRILMSEQYTYLGMRKIVTSRTFTKIEAGTPNLQVSQAITVVRAAFEVQFTERLTIREELEAEGYDFTVSAEDGEITAKMPSLTDRVTGLA